MEVVVIFLLVAVAALAVVSPLLRDRASEEAIESAERAELETARDAKYREIRDAELDHRTGKLSREDWREQDRVLRREAMELLRRLDALEADARDGGERDVAAREASQP